MSNVKEFGIVGLDKIGNCDYPSLDFTIQLRLVAKRQKRLANCEFIYQMKKKKRGGD